MRIVINNYFWGVLKRGIPIYTSELVKQLKKENFEVIELTCPKFLRRMPNIIHNILFVIYEQLITPFVGGVISSKINIYPYNSASIVDILANKSLVIIHDLISLKQVNKSLSSRYVSFCILYASRHGSRFSFISKSTSRLIKRLRLFQRSKSYHFPNTFFSFEEIAKKTKSDNGQFILLVSGHGDNKDLVGALRLFSTLPSDLQIPLKILGLGRNINFAKQVLKNYPDLKKVEVVGSVSLEEVVSLYANCSFVWAHSKAEGYGRAVAEAKLINKNVLCSNIDPFLEQKSNNTFFYNDDMTFNIAVRRCFTHKNDQTDCELLEHKLIKDELCRLYEEK
ncbi:glycosyltransferase [Citrobacter sedlakii]|uniref:glycosyltransferase n=1 Tax=Citrobacter TaxID=544 RepID=UPI001969DB03|nr:MULTISPECIES: glycosyltransferase [Citrobacter]MBM9569390.1 glycosyltransferase [Citrobacter sedlakii]HBL4690851.1 glycosyltransferase [Citrobacter sedlakii]HBL4705761.1 glycosyltransferase [Citrobacter sedlakii]HBL4720039.1 glycosyltransferase [Citrobacter sedlakii]HCA7840990.1 glycosyltransferase [Citrobacter sedlakii]